MRSRAIEMCEIRALDLFFFIFLVYNNPERRWNYARHHLLINGQNIHIRNQCATSGLRFVSFVISSLISNGDPFIIVYHNKNVRTSTVLTFNFNLFDSDGLANCLFPSYKIAVSLSPFLSQNMTKNKIDSTIYTLHAHIYENTEKSNHLSH